TWGDAACVRLTGSASYDGQPVPASLHRASRLAEQPVAVALRAAVPGLRDALVTHSSHKLIAHQGSHLTTSNPTHPRLSNLTGAGAWINDDCLGDLAKLAASGAAAAALATTRVQPKTELSQSFDLEVASEPMPVAIFGGGTGGPFAGLAAARNGAPAVIFEAGWSLGGIPTCGGIHSYYHGVPGGLQDEIDVDTDRRAEELGGKDRVGGFHPEARKISFEDSLQQAGVSVRYGWTAAGAVTEAERVVAVIVARPGEVRLIQPEVVIDATGDGDVAAQAGAPILYGRETDGISHQYSQSAARIDNGRLWHYNFDAGYVDPRNVEDLTRGRRHALQLYWRDAAFGAADRPFNISYLLGLRQSRQVQCDHVLSLAEQVSNHHFDDVIAYTSGHQDNHAFDYGNENDEAMLWCWGLGFWKRVMPHQLPYGSLIPQRLSNILIACRAVGLSREAHMLFRMIRDMQRIGEAAGTAAALALAADGKVRDVKIDELQARLRETGALLADPPAEVALPSSEDLVSTLVDGEPKVAVWHLYQQGEQAVPALLAGLRSDNEHTRWWCAVSLAMIGRREASEELLSVLKQRDERRPTINPEEPWYYLLRMAPRWLLAVGLLGRLEEPRAVEPLTALLAEPLDNPDVPLTVVRALGRIGDPAAVDALRSFIARDDLPLTGKVQNSLAHGEKIPLDVAWQVHLSTAEALQKLGSPMPKLVEPFLNDERAYVREYAARLM
ncbi:MAG: FAD-dependent oxidoreductase, partial [Bacteroidota bacterium]